MSGTLAGARAEPRIVALDDHAWVFHNEGAVHHDERSRGVEAIADAAVMPRPPLGANPPLALPGTMCT